MSECASCGEPLLDDLTECLKCNAVEHRPVLDPRRTHSAISMLKLSVIVAFVGIGVITTIASRIGEFREALLPAIGFVLGGLAVVIVLVKLFATSSEECL
jgi:hypothetical protein